jgi:hypothetical protein
MMMVVVAKTLMNPWLRVCNKNNNKTELILDFTVEIQYDQTKVLAG